MTPDPKQQQQPQQQQRQQPQQPLPPSQPQPIPSRGQRPLAPKTADTQKSNEDEGVRRKQPKSRNGCLTCKAKRMKCDETKPSCQQCNRRGITCGGYKKDLKWKAFGQPRGQVPNQRHSGGFQPTAEPANNSQPQALGDTPPSDKGFGGIGGDAITFPASSSFSAPANSSASVNLPLLPHTNTHSPTERLGSSATDHPSNNPWQFSHTSWLDHEILLSGIADDPEPIDNPQISPLPDLDFLDHEVNPDSQNYFDWRSYGFDTFEDLLNRTAPSPLVTQDDFNMDDIPDISLPSGPLWRPAPRSSSPHEEDWNELFQQPQFRTASPEVISAVFHQYTCRILCIEEDENANPWRVHVWPLAKEYPALYHAVAAMTCFHICRAQPQLRTQAIGHVQCSMETLAANVDSGTISLDAALAASLALAWAETWDCERSSTGKNHIDGARALVKQARSSPNRSPLLDFLINDFLYMDVIARLTSSFDDMSLSRPISYFRDAPAGLSQFDSLMGYACTLFPIIGAVADLVGCIRKREAKRNSPAIISRAIELKKAIERWSPSVDLDSIDHPSSTISDSIQTAEAYRWATLLLLQQAVPELPDKSSYSQLAQKTLVFLATVPLSSTTMIIQHFPLLQAGCEALEDEDREWVRDRWITMSKRMITGIVDKCLDVTNEAWKRRDEFMARRGYCPQTGSKASPHLSSISEDANSGRVIGLDFMNNRHDSVRLDGSPGDGQRQRRGSKATRSASPDFPMSAVFNTGADPLTRSGFVDYTVKGSLHWLSVMKDFGWEVMLG